jgi:16S rRNA (guanine527-N7)-methyltransferase
VTDALRLRLASLAPDGARLTAEQLALLDRYLQLLDRWNRRINLTALPLEGFPEATLDRLIVEPLGASEHVPSSAKEWFDLGSGGGSPAVPLKIARPELRLTMVESRARKAAFLREVARSLVLRDVRVLASRFEELPTAGACEADLVTVRAIRVDAALLSAAARLLRPGGTLMLFSGLASDNRDTPGFRLLRVTPLVGASLTVLERQ